MTADYTSAFSAIDEIAYFYAREELDSEEAQLRFLQSWWCKTYSRPLKDPLLQEYSLEELYFEFRDRIEREDAIEENATHETDKIEQKKQDDAMAWAEEEEKKEAEEIEKEWTPSEQDKAWMEEQTRKAKEEFGEDFGEDINEDF